MPTKKKQMKIQQRQDFQRPTFATVLRQQVLVQLATKNNTLVQMAFLPILSMFATVTALKFIPAKWLKIINVRTE